MSRPARGAWVEIIEIFARYVYNQSRPARGAWVEISFALAAPRSETVAPRKGRVG